MCGIVTTVVIEYLKWLLCLDVVAAIGAAVIIAKMLTTIIPTTKETILRIKATRALD